MTEERTNVVRLVLQVTLPIVILAGGFLAQGKLESMKAEPETVEPSIPIPLVDVIEVAARDVDLTIAAQGNVVPSVDANLVAEVSGRLIHVSPNLVNGGFVAEGEVLVRIDARDYELAVAQARLAVAQAERRLEEERADAQVAREEWDALGKGEPSPLTLREPQVAEAEASLDAARASLERAELDLSRTEVVAPFPARVKQKRVALGEYVARGQTIATGYGIDTVDVRLPLPDDQLAYLALPLAFEGGGVEGPAVTLWTDFAGERREWAGRIVRTEGEIDPRTRMVVAVAQVDDPYGARGAAEDADGTARLPLSVGLFVHADIDGTTLRDVIEVPRTALRDGDVLYTVDTDSRLHLRPVDVVKRGATHAYLAPTIPADERVVVSPLEVVTEGMRVRTTSDGAARANDEGAVDGDGDSDTDAAERPIGADAPATPAETDDQLADEGGQGR